MLTIYHSNRLEALFEHLASVVVHDPITDVFQAETILVQSRGMARWLSMALADRHNIAANMCFPFPGSFIWELFSHHLPEVPQQSIYHKEVMPWKIMQVLPDLLQRRAFAPLQHYLAEDDDIKCYQLAVQIADLFDQYMVYRPQWILDWQAGKDQHWQAQLWRALSESCQEPHRATLMEQFIAKCKAGTLDRNALPTRLMVFGIPALPPAHLEVLARLAEVIDVHFYILNPCLHYWGDILTRKDIARIRTLRKKYSHTSLALYTEGNGLLASMGKLGRDFLELLHHYPCEDEELFVEPDAKSLLSRIQSDILYLIDRSDQVHEIEREDNRLTQLDMGLDNPKQPVAAEDNSVQVHSCHSHLREIEVLHDQLLALFQNDASLQPSDIIVMAPAIDDYAPFIEAVFDSVAEDRFLPWSIADRAFQQEHPVTNHLLRFLDLVYSRFAIDEIFELLDFPHVLDKFDIDRDSLEGLKLWAQNAGVCWAEDAASKADLGLPETQQNTWAFGMDRMLLGHAVVAEQLSHDLLPVNTNIPETIGQLNYFIDRLAGFRSKLSQPQSIVQWHTIITDLIETFFAEDEYYFPMQSIREELQSMLEHAELSSLDRPVSISVIKEYLTTQLTAVDRGSQFLTGQVTFCAMVPMRSIPFKVICMLGMNDAVFPRIQRPLGFDLMANKPSKGDRSRRDDDRYLFLEAILSARNCLYISYVGRSILDNSRMLPSGLVTELADYIDQGYCADNEAPLAILTEHRLQPFSDQYFLDEPLFSYSREWCQARFGKTLPPPVFIDNALVAPDTTFKDIELDQLLRFFNHPVRYFFNHRLNIWLDHDEQPLLANEPFSLDRLETYQLNQELLKKALQGENLDDYYRVLQATGRLPYHQFGQLYYQQLRTRMSAFVDNLQGHLNETLEPLEVNLRLGDFRLSGWLDNITPEHLLRFHFHKLSANDQLRLWICHLLLNCREQDHSGSSINTKKPYPRTSLHIANDGEVRLGETADALDHLRNLLDIYWQGLSRPLPFFPRTSFAFAQSQQRGVSDQGSLGLAEKVWLGNNFVPGEDRSDYSQRLYQETDSLFDQEFKNLAVDVYAPLLRHMIKT